MVLIAKLVIGPRFFMHCLWEENRLLRLRDSVAVWSLLFVLFLQLTYSNRNHTYSRTSWTSSLEIFCRNYTSYIAYTRLSGRDCLNTVSSHNLHHMSQGKWSGSWSAGCPSICHGNICTPGICPRNQHTPGSWVPSLLFCCPNSNRTWNQKI